MSKIRSTHTKPELIVRRLLHAAGYRYRLHRKDLAGKPDLVFAGRRKVIFVHGCFWHQHDAASCLDGRRPKSNTSYWEPKLTRNVDRDKTAVAQLEAEGWAVLTVWECETRDVGLAGRLRDFLGPTTRDLDQRMPVLPDKS
jgi:DNA mismatch endonuclease (patch repair protein)